MKPSLRAMIAGAALIAATGVGAVSATATQQVPGQPFPGQPGQPFPGQPGQPFPGLPGKPTPPVPGQPGQPFPGQPGQPFPGQPGKPTQPAPAPTTPAPAPTTPAPTQPAPSQPAPTQPPAPGQPGGDGGPLKVDMVNDADWAGYMQRSQNVATFVQFSASWCGPCKILKPWMEEYNKADNSWLWVYADTDKVRKTAKELGVKGIPDMRVFKKGQEVDKKTGIAGGQEAVREFINKNKARP